MPLIHITTVSLLLVYLGQSKTFSHRARHFLTEQDIFSPFIARRSPRKSIASVAGGNFRKLLRHHQINKYLFFCLKKNVMDYWTLSCIRKESNMILMPLVGVCVLPIVVVRLCCFSCCRLLTIFLIISLSHLIGGVKEVWTWNLCFSIAIVEHGADHVLNFFAPRLTIE